MSTKNEIISIIREEVEKNKHKIELHHVNTIVKGIYKQLCEYMDDEIMNEFIHRLKPEFVEVVDSLIPIVQEYEEKIDEILEIYIGKWIGKDLGDGTIVEELQK